MSENTVYDFMMEHTEQIYYLDDYEQLSIMGILREIKFNEFSPESINRGLRHNSPYVQEYTKLFVAKYMPGMITGTLNTINPIKKFRGMMNQWLQLN